MTALYYKDTFLLKLIFDRSYNSCIYVCCRHPILPVPIYTSMLPI